jgi:hypothetical protein
MKVIPAAFNEKICEDICKFALDQMFSVDYTKPPVRMWTNYGWPESIIQDSAPVLCFVTPDEFLADIQHCLEEHGIFDPSVDIPLVARPETTARSICLTYVWTYNSYIPKHKDGEYRKTVTVYCNPSWSFSNGGILQWYDAAAARWESLVPTRGTLVLNDKDAVHATTPVKTQKEFRISLQIFILQKPDLNAGYGDPS